MAFLFYVSFVNTLRSIAFSVRIPVGAHHDSTKKSIQALAECGYFDAADGNLLIIILLSMSLIKHYTLFQLYLNHVKIFYSLPEFACNFFEIFQHLKRSPGIPPF